MMLYKFIFVLLIAHLASFHFETWSENNYTSKTYHQRGTFVPGFIIKSYRWESPSGDGCCVKMCYGSRNVRYWCSSYSNGLPSSKFNKIVIGCGDEQLVCN
ncbi:uncharacterized protein OCT59_023681 [Rhizophagus irregularis]|uniref:Uncharacterized protein n=4 Tax=Rhizophagus irregularis TaxID=588596 RepID=A0A916E315_9GLOM|nr:hypothetical protein OCT59_023681 [Rhizophagus irregularis]GBC20664.2 hypothetical protein GLOIN_2v1781738 [Rhizophagus irregularis DAOM 181602=DAOM 197198]CAB4474074.1 unnamed protein product [Rhizophagus irregularis]CAB5184194.1 unnamed protein product [Rhizophagus irregularis]CAB5358220.1 unnamed protein product [Rhizophagus irregularis]